MKQMLMGIALLAIGVIFNPPPVFTTLFLRGPIAMANLTSNPFQMRSTYPDLKVVLNIPATELRLIENDEVLRRIPIAVGQRGYPTPVGKDAIGEIIWNPWWFPPNALWAKDEKVTPPGPKNPLGPVKMQLSEDLRMHGTNQDNSIGTPASHACIRMHNKDAKNLAWILQTSLTPYFDEALREKYAKQRSSSFYVKLAKPVPVEFIYEPIEMEEGKLILHPDLYQKIKDKESALVQKLKSEGYSETELDLNRVAQAIQQWKKGRVILSLSEFLKS